ncbi:MAG TPA: hypothetical protein VGN20_19055 [Mucilaginibacter sp.]|jgi:hypothetical protein
MVAFDLLRNHFATEGLLPDSSGLWRSKVAATTEGWVNGSVLERLKEILAVAKEVSEFNKLQ